MPLDDWQPDDDDDNKSVLDLVNDNIVTPLFSAPVHATTMTMEYFGSRSRMHLDMVKQLSMSIMDSNERQRTYGSMQI